MDILPSYIGSKAAWKGGSTQGEPKVSNKAFKIAIKN